jgi:ATP-binding cassette subfamily F protein 3
MLRISDLTLARGARKLLEGAELSVHYGHKVGLVGANGTGKSSLFAAILGELLPDAGSIEIPRSWVVAHVAQETPNAEVAAIEYVQDGDREFRALERELALPAIHDGEALGELHHRFETIGGYGARARAAALLAGLGVDEDAQARPVAAFSGGWRMRIHLAQALMCRSDLLLLDEPTNHLDLDAVLWLEDWLRRYEGTLLLVTHDRDFLDAIADTIVHIDAGKLVTYRGDYSAFERERAARLALSQASYVKQQRQIAHLRSYIDRFRAKATKARQAQSRIKALERMETIAPAHVESPFHFEFPRVEARGRQLVHLEQATLGYDGEPVLRHVDWSIAADARIGLLGANGAGKSTLLKALAGRVVLSSGTRAVSQHLRLGYFAQHQVDELRADETPLWHLARLDPDARDQDLRDFLGGFDFRGDMATSPVGPFSGGEKARLTLALIVRARPNLLLLDEPTNHLDIEMREALTEALQDYGGALIVVAHDRHLLRATVDELWLVADGALRPFDGDLDDYRAFVLARSRDRGTRDASSDATRTASVRRTQKREEAQARQKRADVRKPLLARQAAIEQDLARLGEEKTALDAWLATSDAYVDDAKERLVASLARQGELTWVLARLEAEWLEIAEKLERVER